MQDETNNHFRISESKLAKRWRVSTRTIQRWEQTDPDFQKAHLWRGKRHHWFDHILNYEAINPELAPAEAA